jgi:outer membrane lipopolysaccharide assembly protein LptE/RlpB
MRTLRVLIALAAMASALAACGDHNRADPNTPHTNNDPDSRRSMMQ